MEKAYNSSWKTSYHRSRTQKCEISYSRRARKPLIQDFLPKARAWSKTLISAQCMQQRGLDSTKMSDSPEWLPELRDFCLNVWRPPRFTRGRSFPGFSKMNYFRWILSAHLQICQLPKLWRSILLFCASIHFISVLTWSAQATPFACPAMHYIPTCCHLPPLSHRIPCSFSERMYLPQ